MSSAHVCGTDLTHQTARQNPNQKFSAYSFSLSTAAESNAALKAVCEPFGGQAPDAVFNCAGAAKPMFFVEMTEEDLMSGMDKAYWVQAWTTHVRCAILLRSITSHDVSRLLRK
jgi:hypothetical protein